MMLWKKTVGENRVDCSTVMVIDRKRRVDQKTLDEPMEDEYRQTSGVGETEHTVGSDQRDRKGHN